jgi:hypothetical protein
LKWSSWVQFHRVKTPLKTNFSVMSPEASGPIPQIVLGLLFGVGQSRNHSWGRFPGNFALFVEVPHGVTRFLEFSKNLGYELGSGAAWAVIFDALIPNIDPESENLGHAEFHCCVLTVNRRSSCIEISVFLKGAISRFWGGQARDGFFRNNRSNFRLSKT